MGVCLFSFVFYLLIFFQKPLKELAQNIMWIIELGVNLWENEKKSFILQIVFFFMMNNCCACYVFVTVQIIVICEENSSLDTCNNHV
jgi:hypothetical protein